MELKIAIPDATLLIGGLDLVTGPILAHFPEVTFQLQTRGSCAYSGEGHLPETDAPSGAAGGILEDPGTKKQKVPGNEAGKGPQDGGRGQGRQGLLSLDDQGGMQAWKRVPLQPLSQHLVHQQVTLTYLTTV